MKWTELLNMLIEIAVFAVGIYLILRFLRQTRGSVAVRGLTLILLVGIVSFFVLIRTLELQRLGLVFEKIADITILGLIIVFQPEIRRAVVHLGDSPIFKRFFRREIKTMPRLLRSIARLSRDRIGALIAIEREGSLTALAESGIYLDAELNSYLIESIFQKTSPLHDGAAILRDERIVSAACLLPLSQSAQLDKRLGTRHRAAVGLSEESDAVTIVVSEETGKISAALGGKLYFDLNLEELERMLDEALGRRPK